MIHGTWGVTPRYRFRSSKRPKGDGEAVCYVIGDRGRRWVVILPDGEQVPSLVHANFLEFKAAGDKTWWRERQ